MSSETEKRIIPLADTQEVLSWFGIGSSSWGYQRWVREDGMRQVDLEDVLGESEAILSVDWRECLTDAVEIIIRQLGACGISAMADMSEDGCQGALDIEGKMVRVKYVPSDNDDFGGIILAINNAIGPKARYRKLRRCEGSDGWLFGLLKNEEWAELEGAAAATVRLLFV